MDQGRKRPAEDGEEAAAAAKRARADGGTAPAPAVTAPAGAAKPSLEALEKVAIGSQRAVTSPRCPPPPVPRGV